ncbi:hypothetical protein SAMN04487764_1536 [Gillisia sp. Hel1_33_143]|uniref:hypothetical protein n=1 Tax=Gillisia sp. Hel1_33_143 TaxID=1336796 RepID=UPI00087B4205|nr:hypothetical protein [Gillisia sp. Hel1_33_143]SDS13735.1 hypothetical protein SAMN04487764_1536 [Gillisia sp. Hel1_33_143]
MSTMTADIIKPVFNALPLEQQQAFKEWILANEELKAIPKKEKKSLLDKVADQLGEEWRLENTEMMISNFMNS